MAEWPAVASPSGCRAHSGQQGRYVHFAIRRLRGRRLSRPLGGHVHVSFIGLAGSHTPGTLTTINFVMKKKERVQVKVRRRETREKIIFF